MAQLAPLAELPGVRLISLQCDDGLDQIAPLATRLPILELSGRRDRDFADTAAIMAHLDLVITPDTSVAHLAGGLGIPVWVALSTVGEWRWLVSRDDSPWYPTMRLFRQTTLGDWDGVFRQMTEALKAENTEKRKMTDHGSGTVAVTGTHNGLPESNTSAALGVECANTDLAKSYRKQAIVLMLQGQPDAAEPYLRDALRLTPDDTDILNDLGLAVWRQGRAAESEPIYRRAHQIKPNDFRILTNLGLALYKQNQIDEAGKYFRLAIDNQPDTSDALMNLGIVLSDQGKFDEAMEWLIRAPNFSRTRPTHCRTLGMNLARQGKWDEAIEKYEQALRIRPDFAEVHVNLAVALLTRGDYERGWPEHEWRLRTPTHSGCRINRTFWNGDNFKGRTILLHAEQGFGDTLQFLRFIPMVKRRGGQVAVRCPTKLLRLVARCPGVDLAFDGSSYEPDCHIHAPLLSLPSIFGTTLATLPAQVPYLATDVVLVEHWRSRAGSCDRNGRHGRCEGRGRAGLQRALETIPDWNRVARKSRPSIRSLAIIPVGTICSPERAP